MPSKSVYFLLRSNILEKGPFPLLLTAISKAGQTGILKAKSPREGKV